MLSKKFNYLVAAALCSLSLTAALAQATQSREYLPPTDPGYGLYYNGSQGRLDRPLRWGYHEGWKQGRKNRDLGRAADPKASDNYQRPPAHGDDPSFSVEQYQRIYRNAFLQGYEHGYRL